MAKDPVYEWHRPSLCLLIVVDPSIVCRRIELPSAVPVAIAATATAVLSAGGEPSFRKPHGGFRSVNSKTLEIVRTDPHVVLKQGQAQ